MGKQDQELISFVQSLRAEDVLVRTVPSESMDCVLKAQLVRLLAADLVLDSQDLVMITNIF